MNLCEECPEDVRGLCCYVNIPLLGYNIILENIPCPFLNIETRVCTIYENRKEKAPWCLHKEDMLGKGGLPQGCMYLDKEKEEKPKLLIKNILPKLTQIEQSKLLFLYNIYNNLKFNQLKRYLHT